jgi:predicted metal-dependent hydrolase
MKTNPTDHTLHCGERAIPYQVHRGDRKTLRIVVYPELTVSVFAPKRAGTDEIRAVVEKKGPWIVRKLDELKKLHPLPAPRQYTSGETFDYLGDQYRLKVVKGLRSSAALDGDVLHVQVKDTNNTASVKRAVDRWYRNRACEILGPLFEEAYRAFSQHGASKTSWSIRTMRRRWGSCTGAGKITFNVHLVRAPVECIEYVIMHELCHLKHHNHSKAFYELLTRCMPDWKQRKEVLESVIIF